ncbi:prenyltransferase [Lentilactobacillus sp. Marseille-Q4993]|uniref:prenyltransferase n=1 Tax=Lentilactobacillus sp. Marseille-Q4993 TaxID=3039492 RepID=UPI0024BD2926|nr:prenyltransferase [Lentilactobacillus sp. Marseille-Q4993]
MSKSVFLELIEVKSLTASIIPFIIGTLFTWYNYHTIDPVSAVLFFVAMLLFDASVNVLDNFNHFLQAKDVDEYRNETNIVGRAGLSKPVVLSILISFVGVAGLIGLYLVYRTGLPLLWMGMFCFAVGFLYTMGPKPIADTPFGEFFSGVTMGFVITLIVVYINTYSVFAWDWASVGKVFLVPLPNTLWIANIMLDNNTCDLDEDIKNDRHTIVWYLGRKNSVNLFLGLNVLAYVAIVAAVVLKIAPWTTLLALLSIPLVYKQAMLFAAKQVKTETFICSVKILVIGGLAMSLSYWLGIII